MPSVFDTVQKRWNVARFLRRRGFETSLTETGECHIKCPRCHDHKPRLYINTHTKRWLCYNCPPRNEARGRSAISFVKFLLDIDDAEAVKIITQSSDTAAIWDEVDDDEERERAPKKEIREEPLPQGFRPLKLPMNEKSEPYWDYLLGRGITPTMVRQYEIGFCPRGPYRGRVIVPIVLFGMRRGWVGRAINENVKRKYMNPPNVHTSRILFNVDAVQASGHDEVVLVEGLFDALRMPNSAVCTFGKKISNQQISLLTQAGFRQWIFLYDGDAVEDAEHYASNVPSYVECFRAILPPDLDPGSAPAHILSRAIQEAEPWHFSSVGGGNA